MTWADDALTFRSVYADDFRLLVDGVDVSRFRGVESQYGSYQLQEPYEYGPATFNFPQVAGIEYRSTTGDMPAELRWLRKGARAQLVPVLDGVAQRVVWRGFIADIRLGDGIEVGCLGDASGKLSLGLRKAQMFTNTFDVGYLVFDAFRDANLPFEPTNGPVTGIEVEKRGSWEDALTYCSGLLADAQDLTPTVAWTVRRNPADTAYRMGLKDTTTVHATVMAETIGVSVNLTDDLAEQPNTFYGTGFNQAGRKWGNLVTPGLMSDDNPPDYPFTGGDSFGEGTTDADTDTGSGITALHRKLAAVGLIDREDITDLYDDETTDAVKQLQKRAGLNQSGNVNPNTWDALFDVSVTGYYNRGATFLPLAQVESVREFNRTAVGNVTGKNPNWDPQSIEVARFIPHGKYKKRRAVKWSEREIDRLNGKNLVGTITLAPGVGVFEGEYAHGDPDPTPMSSLQLRAGMNILARGIDGDTLFHIAGINVNGDGTVSMMVDTQARDLLTLGEIRERNRESRRNKGREFRVQLRNSGVKDAIVGWWENGGQLGQDTVAAGGEWTVFPLAAGQEGTCAKIRLEVNESAFYAAVFAEEVTAKWLNAHMPNPGGKDADDNYNWATNAQVRKLRNRRSLLAAFGTEDEPCGYGDRRHTRDDGTVTDAPVTGVFESEESFAYSTRGGGDGSVLWVAVYAFEDAVIKGGRIMWQQIEESV